MKTILRYAASDNFNYLRGCLPLLPSVFSWAPDTTDIGTYTDTDTNIGATLTMSICYCISV